MQLEPQEVIEFPIVLVDVRSLRVVGEFRSYVRPVHHPQLTPFCTQLTGIQQSWLDNAPTWPEALIEAQAWCDRKLAELGWTSFTFVTCGHWDLKTMIGKQCAASRQHVPERFRQWVNIKDVF